MDSNEASARRLEIVLVFIVGFLQVLQAGWSFFLNAQTASKIEDVKRSQDISDKILQAEPIIAGGNPARAKVVLGALYVRAVSDSDKEDLARIAVLSDKKELRDAISYIIQSDSQATPTLASRLDALFKPIAVQQVKAASAQANGLNTGATSSQSPADLAKRDTPIQPTPEIKASAALSDKLSEQIDGWIYLGSVTRAGKVIADPTTNITAAPANNTLVTTTTFVALREQGTTLQGDIKTILPPGKQVRVRGISMRRLTNGGSAIWASVSKT